jgi:fructose-1,6-bisphosphatase/inositol monophosphatase family enzyme
MLANKPWDTSAGVLVAREAEARVLDHDGSEHSQSPTPQSQSPQRWKLISWLQYRRL